MSVVERAFDTHRGHHVAIKRLLLDTSDEKHRREITLLFEREYHTLVQLAHPRIIQVYDYGVDADGPYYTMEVLSGESLTTRAPLPWRKACELIRDIASSLAILHSRRLVHRDVTPNNIYYTSNDRVKLIDFGAMTPMGLTDNVVGTPPFIAPEALQKQPIDGRADLYSLGASLYFVLTARHAYRARDLKQLYSVWRTPPLAPSHYQPEIPNELDRLVLALLSLSAVGRPSSAAEVFERLTAIAGLSSDEQIQVAQAYLNTPVLVGRELELKSVRRQLKRASKGRGAVVLVESEAEIGRSRFLDAAALEATLLGFVTIQADAKYANEGWFGVAKHLVQELCAADPALSNRVDAPGVINAIESEDKRDNNPRGGIRSEIIEELCRLMREAGARYKLALVVDDLHLIDEPSSAFLASLSADIASRTILVLVSVEAAGRSQPASALQLLSQSAKRVKLRALSEKDCRSLLSSMFGEMPQLDSLNLLAYRSYAGVPGQLIEGVQALIEQRLLQYEGGRWQLTDDRHKLERILERGRDIQSRLSGLSEDARELLALIALDRDQLMEPADYLAISRHRDNARLLRALNQLVQERLLLPVGALHYRFSQKGLQHQVAEGLDEARRRELCLRLAERSLIKQTNPIYSSYYFLEAKQLLSARDTMRRCSEFAFQFPNAEIIRNPITLDTCRMYVEQAEKEGWEPTHFIDVGVGLILNATYCGFPELSELYIRKMLHALTQLSGLADYAGLQGLDDSQRLQVALQGAQKRCQEASGNGESFNVIVAIKRLAQTCIQTAIVSYYLASPELLEEIPDLSPLTSLSPAVDLVQRLTRATSKIAKGQVFEGWSEFKILYSYAVKLDPTQIDAMTLASLKWSALGFLCAHESEYAAASAPAYIDECQSHLPTLAQSCRVRYLHALGDAAATKEALRNFEIMSVQAGAQDETRNSLLAAQIRAFILSDDLMGLKQSLHKLEKIVETRPGWKYRLALTNANYLRCCGKLQPALAVIEESLADMSETHPDWALSAATRVILLTLLGRYESARDLGFDYLERSKQLNVPSVHIDLALALCLSRLEQYPSAQKCFESALVELGQRGVGGVLLGYCHEVGARVAIRKGDLQAFVDHCAKCRELYKIETNSVLALKYSGLMREAETREQLGPANELEAIQGVCGARSDVDREIIERLTVVSTSHGARDLYEEALAIAVQRTEARGGLLYLCTGEGLKRVCATGGLKIPGLVDVEITRFFTTETNPHETVDSNDSLNTESQQTSRITGAPCEDPLLPVLLEYQGESGLSACGVIALAIDRDRFRADRLAHLSTLARFLAERREVTSIRLA
ncbi:MAG: protein kinase [Deltaproteobacteria bacterium]|nr:protein kinase [Deltaproteobacteria bacterium]